MQSKYIAESLILMFRFMMIANPAHLTEMSS